MFAEIIALALWDYNHTATQNPTEMKVDQMSIYWILAKLYV
jgi:hypothetical protein